MTDLAKLRAKLAAATTAKQGERKPQNTGDNASYAFWDIPEDSSATIRFLPDADQDNALFWVDRQVIRMPFQGVVGGEYPTDKTVTVTVPCIDMFGMTCPIIARTKPWWRDPAKEDLARTYYKKKSYIFQGFVVNSPMAEASPPENPIRRFVINPSLYEIIEKSLVSPDMEDMPTDFVGGRDFKITKTRKGEYANYSTSSWSFKTRALSETELSAVDQFGLWDLKTFRGRVPDNDEVDAIIAMFESSLNGEPFDVASFGKYYRPYSARGEEVAVAASAATSAQAAPVTRVTESAPAASAPVETPAPAAKTADGAGKPNPADILERIRQRTGK
jgi:hypothetical protein